MRNKINDYEQTLLSHLLELPEYKRKIFISCLIASMLNEDSREDAKDIYYCTKLYHQKILELLVELEKLNLCQKSLVLNSYIYFVNFLSI